MANGSKQICVGRILGAHGVAGAVRVRSLTDNPEDLFAYAPLTDEAGTRVFVLSRKNAMKDHFIATVEGLATREAALALQGQKLFVARENMPALATTAYYVADLVGLEARDDETGTLLGRVEAAHDYGAGLFLEIKPKDKPSFMLPFQDAFVPKVNLADGFLTARVPEGFTS